MELFAVYHDKCSSSVLIHLHPFPIYVNTGSGSIVGKCPHGIIVLNILTTAGFRSGTVSYCLEIMLTPPPPPYRMSVSVMFICFSK